MAVNAQRRKPCLALCAAVGALVLGGCSMDDIEFNGGVFDALGVNKAAKGADPKLAARTPLVVPPDTQRLPAPGTPGEAQLADVSPLINDPDRVAKVSQAELARQQQEFCAKNYDPAVAAGDASADGLEGPLGRCTKSLLTAIEAMNKGESYEDQIAGDEN